MTVLANVLRWCLWPVVVLTTLYGFWASFRADQAEIGLALVPFGAILLLAAFEVVLPARSRMGSLSDPQMWNDAFHGLVGQGGGNTLGQAAFVFGAAAIAGEISERWGGNLWPAQLSLWIQVPLVVFLADGLDYWRHRWMHTTAWLWPVHALHHDGDRLNILKSGRGHLLDMFLRNLMCYAPLALIGVPREVMLAYAAAVTLFGPVAHANVSLSVPSFLHRWVLTPKVHHVHHARLLALSSSNYANVFPVWDVLFGTFVDPDTQPHFEYGVEGGLDGDGPPQDILGQLWAPFAVWRSAWRTKAGSVGVPPKAKPISTADLC